jgi:hypothetical protein
VLAHEAAQDEVQLFGHVTLEARREVELEALSRDPAELPSPVRFRAGPQGDGAARSAALVQPDEELAAPLADELEGLGGGDHLHGAIVAPSTHGHSFQ